MKLSTFPYGVQKEIFDNMKIPNLFLLSFVSKNMKKLIKSSQMTRFKSISHIVNGKSISPGIDRRIYIPFMTMADNIMEISERREETKNDYFQLNVSGKTMDFRLSNQYKFAEAYFHPLDKEAAIESIHNYLVDIFGDTVDYQYVEHYKKFVPHLPKLSLCHSFWSGNGERIRDIKPIEEYIASSPVLKRTNMNLDTPDLFNPESKFYQIESIYLTLYTNTVPTFLRHFQGRQAFLTCYKWEILDLIEFMNRWKSGEECRKYKIGFHPNTDPIISHSYVVRKTDNRVASVSIQKEAFCFGVWNKTEEQFLRMVA
ncbi:hypothetical protein B9Z55_009747 [Caenorhabditis nigoni]|uniref:F-box domain-containing protein n=1 Tax=Caenorhabditis nigoni TaxID=1611254 RepID=A0A2G5UTE1_9PELO|nr:hypothetical protein B9Z55_009747 [Caenorhabditis nigoni]